VNGGHWHFTYDANHLLLTMQDPRQYPNGPLTTNVYDSSGRVTQQTDPMNRSTTFVYGTDSNGYQTTTITDPNGNVTVERYSNYVLASVTKGSGTQQAATWTYGYDPFTLGVTSVTDPNGHAWSASYDSNGNVLSGMDPLGHQYTNTYDVLNDLTSVTDPNNVKTSLSYDGSGNLTSVSRPLTSTNQTATSTLVYGDSTHPGDVTAITDQNGTGHTTSFAHDPATGNLLSMTDAVGDKTTYGYDNLGRVTSTVSPNGNVTGGNPSAYTTSIGYNPFGDITSVTDPLQHQTLYAYDADRNLQSVEDARLNTTTYTNDADNELTGVGYPDGTSIGFAYDGDGNVLSQADGLNHPTSYTYDPLNRVLTMTDPLNRVTTYGYDLAGNLTSLKDALSPSRTTSYGYDAANRLTSISYSDGVTPNVSFGYDNDNQRTSMTDGTGTSSYSYDSLNRLTQSKNGVAQIVKYGYDLARNLTSLTYPSNSVVTRTYDLANRLTQVKDWSSNATSFAYDADSNMITETYPNSTTAGFTYNAADQLTQIIDKKSGTAFWTFGYSRDVDGQLGSASDPLDGLQHTYGYDTLNRLTSDARSAGTTSWSYNAADELTSIGDTGANTTTTLGYDLAHELTSLVKKTGSTTNQNLTLSYNANGDRTQQTDSVSGTMTSYGYDQANRLTSFTKSGSTSTYKYNGDGLRASKVVSGKTNTFTWDIAEGLPLTLLDSSYSYITGPGGLPVEQISGSKAYYYYQDQLGSTRGLLDGRASTVASYTYGPYGDLKSSSGSITTPFQYAGQYTDSESGLQYLRARYYDPASGQFVSIDPLRSLTMQAYAYTRDNPLSATDPSGRGTIQLCMAGSAGLGAGGIVQSCTAVGISGTFPYLSLGNTITVGGGGASPSLSLTAQVMVSNANSIRDLGGPFYYGGGTAGLGPVGGYEQFWGKDACGRSIAGGGPEVGVGGNIPVPASGHAGVSYTWTSTTLGGSSNTCPC